MSLDWINQFSVYPLIMLVGYVIGSSNMAAYLARLCGVDLKAGGSGNGTEISFRSAGHGDHRVK